MSPRESADTSFDTVAEKYVGFNFHRASQLEQAVGLVTQSAPSIIVLTAKPGAGRRYFVEATSHTATQAGNDTIVARLDLDGYEPDRESPATYLNHLLVKRAEKPPGPLAQLVDRATVDVKLSAWVASFLSIVLTARLTPKAISRAIEDLSGPPRPDQERLSRLIDYLTDGAKLILHVTDDAQLPLTLRRWLFDVQRRNTKLVVAFSCPPGGEVDAFSSDANVTRIDLEPLDLEALTTAVDERFNPNEFPTELYDALLRYSNGFPCLVARKMKDLIDDKCIDWSPRGTWTMAPGRPLPEVVGEEFSATLYEPIDRLRERLPDETYRRLETFLQISALCGENVPATYVCRHLNLSESEWNVLVDLIDDELISGLSRPWFRDCGYGHPGFNESLVYQFDNPALAWTILDRLDRAEQHRLAGDFLAFLDRNVKVTSRAIARLFLTLTEFLGRDDDRASYQNRLAWWIGRDEADHLEAALVAALKHAGIEPRTLWAIITDKRAYRPPHQSLALLNAYERQTGGVPIDSKLLFSNTKGLVLYHLGLYAESEPYLREAVACARRVLGDDHRNTLTAIGNMGTLLGDQGKLGEAEPYHREALEGRRRILGDEHPETLASINNMGSLLNAQGKLDEAEPYCREALEGNRRMLGDDHPHTLISTNNMGELLRRLGKLDEAEPYVRESLEGFRRILGDEHPNTLASINNMGGLLTAQGRLDDAEPYRREALEGHRRMLGDDHPHTLESIKILGDHLQAQGKHEEGELLLREADMGKKGHPPGNYSPDE